jgi:hypothetical protein
VAVSETYYCGDASRALYASNDAKVGSVKEVFPWFDARDYFSISAPVHHDVLKEHVVTGYLHRLQAEFLTEEKNILLARKFCLQSKTSHFRVYRLFRDEKPEWLPPSAKVFFIGENEEEFGRAFNPLALSFYDLYFSGDAEEIEATFHLPKRRGAYQTYFGATVADGKPVRLKQYVYDEQNDGCSDWDVIYFLWKKNQGQ